MGDPISSTSSKPKYFTAIDDGPTPLLPRTKKKEPKPAMDLDAAPTSVPPVVLPKASDPGAPGQSIDFGAWPTPLLESNAKALHPRIAKHPKSVTVAEKERLGKIEGELSKRYVKERAPTLGPVAKEPRVELCKATVEISVLEYSGLQHHWLRTSKKEVGMGPEGGGVPGVAGGNNGSYLGKTTSNNHAGRGDVIGSECEELPDVDEDCVNDHLKIGTPTGRWAPGVNDCHTVVGAIVTDCKKPGTAGTGNAQ